MNLLQILLKEELKKSGLSIREAARQIETSHTTLYRVVEGNAIDLETHIKICDWLGINPSSAIDALSSNKDALPKKIAVLLEKSPKLAEKLDEVVNAIQKEKIDPEIFEEILSFIAFKILVT
jgi:transcriptional regulator with XRE-family HTH domain